jgi:hypothetical protein
MRQSGGQPGRVAAQPRLQLPQQVTLALEGMYFEGSVLWQQTRQQGAQECLHGRLLDQQLKMRGRHVSAPA